MKKLFTSILFVLLFISLSAQIAPNKYYVQFTDKNNSPYSIDNPEEFLTQRSLDRRAKYSIDVVEQDLPVNPQYLQGVASAGATILAPTKWLNGVTIYTTEQSVLDAINALPYVENVAKMHDLYNPGKKSFFENEEYDVTKPATQKNASLISSYDYGFAANQIEQLNGTLLHGQGFKGEGMVIAVLDAGYDVVKTHQLFDSLWTNNQILGSMDFVDRDTNNVYAHHYHGRMVLSCMGANVEGLMVGTAPKASYWLFRSEDGATENVIEEYNWVSAAEYADSVGVDIINSSLGYIDFDNPFWDHTYEDMNGSTAVVTIGADIAAEKGILVVNSAGNSGGNGGFPWIGAPADGFNVFSIGAVDPNGNRAGFSSIGPTFDGRIKPVVMAQGQGSAIADDSQGVSFGSGTSFSSPILAGMSACLMQAFPDKTPYEIMESLKDSGDNSSSPDNQYGWGIPDFMAAYSTLTIITNEEEDHKNLVSITPNPFTNEVKVKVVDKTARNIELNLVDINGRQVFSLKREAFYNTVINISDGLSKLPSGIYFMKVRIGDFQEIEKLIKP
ncbi:MAG: hypothetical protein C0598_14365 [Marinilabiliales bacterium]|nr:MAG: hypothetical protein C0598_14365 [Marinilabiliales bacterium]